MITNNISRAIDVIRGMAALGVIWGHSIYGLNFPLELNGAFWVWIFLSVSGYLIGRGFIDGRYTLNSSGYKKFIINRSLRIVPLYEIALVFGLFVERISNSKSTSLLDAVRQMMFSTGDVSLAGPLWTVTVEVQFYLVSFFLVLLIIEIPYKPFSVALLCFSFLFAGWYNGIAYGCFGQPRTLIGNIHFFVFGLFLSTKPLDTIFCISRVAKIFAILLLIMLAWYIANWYPEYFWRFGNEANKFIPLGGASLITLVISFIVLSFNHKESKRIFSYLDKIFAPAIRFLGWCGFYTYGIYVWHSILVKLNISLLHVPIGPYLLFFLLLSIPLAVVSYRFIESPILKFKVN